MIKSVLENTAGICIVICSDEEYTESHSKDILTAVEIGILKDVNNIFEPISAAIRDLGGILNIFLN